MELQRPVKAKAIFEKVFFLSFIKLEDLTLPDFKTYLYMYNNQDSWCQHIYKKRHGPARVQWSSAIDPHTYGQLILDKSGEGVQWKKDNLMISRVKTIDNHMQQKDSNLTSCQI